MTDRPNPEFVFDKNGWIERNFSPIGERITAFQAHRLKAAAAVEAFELGLRRDPKAAGETHFHFLGEEVIRRTVLERVPFVDFTEVKLPWRQHVGGCQRRETRAGEPARGAVSTANVIAGNDNDFLGAGDLAANRFVSG